MGPWLALFGVFLLAKTLPVVKRGFSE